MVALKKLGSGEKMTKGGRGGAQQFFATRANCVIYYWLPRFQRNLQIGMIYQIPGSAEAET